MIYVDRAMSSHNMSPPTCTDTETVISPTHDNDPPPWSTTALSNSFSSFIALLCSKFSNSYWIMFAITHWVYDES